MHDGDSAALSPKARATWQRGASSLFIGLDLLVLVAASACGSDGAPSESSVLVAREVELTVQEDGVWRTVEWPEFREVASTLPLLIPAAFPQDLELVGATLQKVAIGDTVEISANLVFSDETGSRSLTFEQTTVPIGPDIANEVVPLDLNGVAGSLELVAFGGQRGVRLHWTACEWHLMLRTREGTFSRETLVEVASSIPKC